MLKLGPSTETQLSIELTTSQEREEEAERQIVIRDDLMAACRAVARNLTSKAIASDLDFVWSRFERPVAESYLDACLASRNRNNFRLEWIVEFAKHSRELRALLRELGEEAECAKTPEQELKDLKDTIQDEYPRQADKLIRRAKHR